MNTSKGQIRGKWTTGGAGGGLKRWVLHEYPPIGKAEWPPEFAQDWPPN